MRIWGKIEKLDGRPREENERKKLKTNTAFSLLHAEPRFKNIHMAIYRYMIYDIYVA